MTDKHIPASKLLALPQFSDPITGQPAIFHADLRALIDEAPEVDGVAVNVDKIECLLDKHGASLFYSEDVIPVSHGDIIITQDQLLNVIAEYASPPPSPDLTKLVGELVEALDDANKKIGEAKDFEYESQEHISESAYELNGFLGSTAADISVNWQKTIDSNNELLTRAKEYLK